MTLLEEAKKLKIKGAHLMKDTTLAKKVAEAKEDVEDAVEEIAEAVEEIAEAVEAVGVATASVSEVVNEVEGIKRDPIKMAQLLAEALKFKKYLGDTSVEYLKLVSAYREYMPDEYQEAKHNIEIWL